MCVCVCVWRGGRGGGGGTGITYVVCDFGMQSGVVSLGVGVLLKNLFAENDQDAHDDLQNNQNPNISHDPRDILGSTIIATPASDQPAIFGFLVNLVLS